MCYDIIFFKILKFLPNAIISTLSLKVFKGLQNIFWKKIEKKIFSYENVCLIELCLTVYIIFQPDYYFWVHLLIFI